MGVKFLLLAIPLFIVIISGCTQTGSIVNKSSTGPGELVLQPLSEEPFEMPVVAEGTGNKTSEAVSAPEPGANKTGDLLAKPAPTDPCESITCPNSVTTCDDGFKARCKNQCTGGVCPVCRPDCTGHELEPEKCELSCGACEEENKDDCQCDLIVPCDGNGICEEGEYPGSDDCPDCGDGNDCTDDLYNYTYGNASGCYWETIVPCCGNGACENETSQPENRTSCPADCNASQALPGPGTENGAVVSITFVEPQDEWVEIENTGTASADMTNWTLIDAANHIYTFPGFTLDASSSVLVHTSHGTDNATELFWGRSSPVWNNDGDNATLKNTTEDIISTYSY